MAMKGKKLFDLYKEWMRKGFLDDDGLCRSLPDEYKYTFSLFYPTRNDELQLIKEGHFVVEDAPNAYYFAGDLPYGRWYYYRRRRFNPVRQTIVLLICAIHNEL